MLYGQLLVATVTVVAGNIISARAMNPSAITASTPDTVADTASARLSVLAAVDAKLHAPCTTISTLYS